MKRLASALILTAIVSCSRPASLEIDEPWTRESVGSATTAAVFMTITAPTTDRLIGASTPVAAKTDLMTMGHGGNVMAMEYLDAIDIPANRPVRLEPSGLHVWLAQLKQPLKAGETFPLNLRFEKAGERQLTVKIIKAADAPPQSDAG